MSDTLKELAERLEGPAKIANGIVLAVIGAGALLWAVSGQPIVLPSWMGWLGVLLIITAVLQVINGVLVIWKLVLDRRLAPLRAKAEAP